ncbi:MAG: thymidine kinase [Bacteroidota bacterium]
MFIEVNSANQRTGWVEVICGSMFSGKTEELIRRLRRADIANLPTRIFKPTIDTRYAKDAIVSHNQLSIPSITVAHSQDMLHGLEGIEVVGVDEAQFFDAELPGVVREMANQGIRVIAAGLDMDFRGEPFGPMPALLAMAEFVTKVHAICQVCGSLANYSYRLTQEGSQVLLGEKTVYEPRCRNCFFHGQEQEAAQDQQTEMK